MSKREELESKLELAQAELRGWIAHPHCDERTRMIDIINEDIDHIQDQIEKSK